MTISGLSFVAKSPVKNMAWLFDQLGFEDIKSQKTLSLVQPHIDLHSSIRKKLDSTIIYNIITYIFKILHILSSIKSFLLYVDEDITRCMYIEANEIVIYLRYMRITRISCDSHKSVITKCIENNYVPTIIIDSQLLNSLDSMK